MEICDNSISNPLVLVRCFTYNQSAYINDAMKGFVMQRTDFPFVVAIVDDASTDGEQEDIRRFMTEEFELSDASVAYEKETEYAYIQYAQHKTNKSCFMVAMFLKENHNSQKKKKFPYLAEWRDGVKYEAICEGDDYWIDPLKLQKQVDFLESNPEYSICFHSANVRNVESIQYSIQCEHIENRDYSASELFENWIAPTASFLYKKEALNIKMNNRFRSLNGDIILLLKCAKIGKLRGFADCMSVYRVQNGGVTYDKSMKKTRYERYPEHYLFIKDNFSDVVKIDLINKFLSDYYLIRAKECSFSVRTLTDLCMFAFVYPKNIYLKLCKLFKLLLGGEKKN